MRNIYCYLAIMTLVTYALRVIPLTLIRRPIRNRFLRSFLQYVPYASLAVMTIPAILETTNSPWTGGAALILGIVSAWLGASLFFVAMLCCCAVFLLSFLF